MYAIEPTFCQCLRMLLTTDAGTGFMHEAFHKDNVYYNLQGVRVAQPTKGLYIVNGKKVMIK